MAEKTPMEDVLKRAYDANVRYWETVGRATTDYLQAVTRLWAEAPLAWTPGLQPKRDRPAESGSAQGTHVAPALLLEGAAGGEARAVVMLSNDLDRDVEAAAVVSRVVGPAGETIGLTLRTEPAVVRIAAGGRVPVTLIAALNDSLQVGADYRAEVTVPGLSARGVPVVVRRTG